MARYLNGPSVQRFPTRKRAVAPGEAFEHLYEPAHEAMALASGAVARLDSAETIEAEWLAAGYIQPPPEDEDSAAVAEAGSDASAPAAPASRTRGRRAKAQE